MLGILAMKYSLVGETKRSNRSLKFLSDSRYEASSLFGDEYNIVEYFSEQTNPEFLRYDSIQEVFPHWLLH